MVRVFGVINGIVVRCVLLGGIVFKGFGVLVVVSVGFRIIMVRERLLDRGVGGFGDELWVLRRVAASRGLQTTRFECFLGPLHQEFGIFVASVRQRQFVGLIIWHGGRSL